MESSLVIWTLSCLQLPEQTAHRVIRIILPFLIFQEKLCEESSSFDLTPYDLASAMDAINVVLEEQAKVVQQNEINAEFNMELASSGVLTVTHRCFSGIVKCHYQDLENNF